MLQRLLLTVVSLASAMTAFSDSALPVWTAGSVSVSPAGGGRARLHCEFPRASAAIVFFDR